MTDVIIVTPNQNPITVQLANVGPQGPPGPSGGGGSGYTWQEVTSTAQQAQVDFAYVANNSSLVTITLPSTANFGDVLQICGKGAGGWKLAQNAGQSIHFGTQSTTQGTGGSLASQSSFDCIELVCITPNTDFLARNSQGNITVT
jgi:hypothetical protein